MNEEQLKPLEEPIVEIKPAIINLPEKKENNQNNKNSNDDIVKDLPTWNIEPPIEIKRGN